MRVLFSSLLKRIYYGEKVTFLSFVAKLLKISVEKLTNK